MDEQQDYRHKDLQFQHANLSEPRPRSGRLTGRGCFNAIGWATPAFHPLR
jgi:hypothetical protein